MIKDTDGCLLSQTTANFFTHSAFCSSLHFATHYSHCNFCHRASALRRRCRGCSRSSSYIGNST
jgi:hypothetical protein